MNPLNLRARQDIDRRAYVKGQQTLLERDATSRNGWRGYGAYYLPKFGGSTANVSTMGGSGTIVGQ